MAGIGPFYMAANNGRAKTIFYGKTYCVLAQNSDLTHRLSA